MSWSLRIVSGGLRVFEGVSQAFQECSRGVPWMAEGISGSFIGFRRFSGLQVRSLGTSGDPRAF